MKLHTDRCRNLLDYIASDLHTGGFLDVRSKTCAGAMELLSSPVQSVPLGPLSTTGTGSIADSGVELRTDRCLYFFDYLPSDLHSGRFLDVRSNTCEGPCCLLAHCNQYH